MLNDMIETSLTKYSVAAIIMPTTAALIPSSERKTTTNFFKYCQTGKKKSTSKALGRNIAIDPIIQPNKLQSWSFLF